ncbi:hypothetical protein COV21_03300 [Candidatus Woesearchaeota archaeon CG10_big_fil_rev_8_21_14_0_10_45_5]|nr:MAG: hypothetical protein COV21_03300 [Candidatus Woesearchaeota archaeon CG10_big_fil_rev_8_21_14_0_10_45_5]
MSALRRILPEIKWKDEDQLPREVMEKLVVKWNDFENALRVVEPSAMREVLVEVPKVKWDDVGGLENIKQQMKEMIEWPLQNPESFSRIGIKPPKGVLMYGPPGCGKTLMARAVATESGANFISIKGPQVYSKWVGESEKAIRDIFRRAKQVAPTIIFFDEIDALAPRRNMKSGTQVTETVVSQLLSEMSGIEDLKGVVVIAATNRPDMVDPALLRPGRFDRIILTGVPDENARLAIFKIHTKGMPLKDVNIKDLAKKTEGYVGSDIEAVCREAAILSLRADIKAKEVTKKEFSAAVKKVPPSVNPDIVRAYAAFKDSMKSAYIKDKQKQKEEKPGYFG